MGIGNILSGWNATRTQTLALDQKNLSVRTEKPSFAGRIARWIKPTQYKQHRISILQDFFSQIERFNAYDPVQRQHSGSRALREVFGKDYEALAAGNLKRMPKKLTERQIKQAVEKTEIYTQLATQRQEAFTLRDKAAAKQTTQTPQTQTPKTQTPQTQTTKTTDSPQTPTAKPKWTPQGHYLPSQLRDTSSKMRSYALFLQHNPEQIPNDIKTKLKGQPAQFPRLMNFLMKKHFPHLAARTAADNTQNKAQKKTLPPTFRLTANPRAQDENKTRYASPTPNAVPPQGKFYHERQEDFSGLCGMHALNAFLGGPLLHREALIDETVQHLSQETGMPPEDVRQMLKEGMSTDPATLQRFLTQFAKQKHIEPKLAQSKVETGIPTPQNEAQKNTNAAHYNSFPGDRLIAGYSGGDNGSAHFVALRRHDDGQWTLVNSLQTNQKKVNLGQYLAGLKGLQVIHAEPDFSFKN